MKTVRTIGWFLLVVTMPLWIGPFFLGVAIAAIWDIAKTNVGVTS